MYRSQFVVLASAIIVCVVIGASVPTNGQASGHVTYLRCGSLIDGKSEQARKNVVVAVEGEKIKEVGGAEAGSDVIDLSRETCMPGLIDTHTHVLLQGDITAADYDAQLLKESPEYRTIVATTNLWRALAFGFTTIRDLETEGAGYADVDLKKAINNGVIPGPRMQVATRALDVTGAYPLLGYAPNVPVPHGVQIVDGADEGRKAVREQISYGADWIKVYSDRSYRVKEDTAAEVRQPKYCARRRGLQEISGASASATRYSTTFPHSPWTSCAPSSTRHTERSTKWRRTRWLLTAYTTRWKRVWTRSNMGTTSPTRT